MGQDYDCARMLLTKGADTYCQDVGGRTPLHTFYNPVSQQIFYNHYAELDPWTQDHEGMTILHFLCWSSKSPVELLQRVEAVSAQSAQSPARSSCLDIKDAFGRSVLHFLAQRGNIDLLKFFLSRPNTESLARPDWRGISVLHYATESSRVHTIDLFIQAGYDIDARDNSGHTLLHHAAMKDNLAAVKQLLDLGASTQLVSVDSDNRTPLQLATAYRSESVIEYLQAISPSQQPHHWCTSQEELTPTTPESQIAQRSWNRYVCNLSSGRKVIISSFWCFSIACLCFLWRSLLSRQLERGQFDEM